MEKEITTKNNLSVGIVGGGFVGSTCYQVFHQLKDWSVKVYDLNKEKSRLHNAMGSAANFVGMEDVANCDVVFVCVPTPMKMSTGECDTSIVEHCVATIRGFNKYNTIVIKSTVPPGTTKKINFNYGNVFFNPEFLTEANAYNDFVSLEYQIIGINEDNKEKVDHNHPLLSLYRDCYVQKLTNGEQLFIMDSTSAEMIKYVKNCYLATRISFFNEIKQVCDKLDLNYEKVAHYAGLDNRIGQHYNKIYDDKPFFAGHCLPKDINALIHLMKILNINSNVLSGVWKTNLERSEGFERDWEGMIGRAVVKDD